MFIQAGSQLNLVLVLEAEGIANITDWLGVERCVISHQGLELTTCPRDDCDCVLTIGENCLVLLVFLCDPADA